MQIKSGKSRYCLATLSIVLFAAWAHLPPAARAQQPQFNDPQEVTATESPFSSERAFEHVQALTSSEMQGRQSGLRGGDLAEEYVAELFGRWGLEPAGDDQTFFQTFPMLVTELRSAAMEILDTPFSPIGLTIHEDFYPLTHSGSGDVTAEAVFVGHGISKPDKGWDDYGDADVTGKIVLILRGRPPVPDQDWSEEYSRVYTANEAQKRGAAAILFMQGQSPAHGAAIMEEAYNKDMPMAYIAEHVAEKLLTGLGETMKTYKEALAKAPKALATGYRVHVDFKVDPVVDGKTRNVIGMVPGSDPALKNEYIIVGGHLDHVGQCPGGPAFVGANDNASGSAVVLELARSFAQAQNRARRSLIFALFAAEEQGLLGSKFMADHLPVEKERVALMINYDMAGHGDGTVGIGGREAFPEIWKALVKAGDSVLGEKVYLSRAWGAGSDQASFRAIGLPVFSVWSRGDHLFYHTVNDQPQFVKKEVLGAVGTVSEQVIRFIADWPHPLADGYQHERQIVAGSCQVDFAAAWTGLNIKEEELEGAFAAGPTHVHGALWNIEMRSWIDPPDSAVLKSDPFTTAELFSCFSKLKAVSKLAALGKSFRDVHNNATRQLYTLIPCVTPKTIECVGEQGASFLSDLGAVFVITDTAALAENQIPESLPIIARLSEQTKPLDHKYENLIVLCSGDPAQWLDQAEQLKEMIPLFVIHLNNEKIDFNSLKDAMDKLKPASCHLDLTGLKTDVDDTERMAILFKIVRQMKDIGMEEDHIKDLFGGNLRDWPKN